MSERQATGWKGPDLRATRRTTVPASKLAYVEVLTTPDNIPGVRKHDFEKVEISSNSRNAQLHLAADEHAPLVIAGQLEAKGIKENLGYGFPVQIPVRNYSPRPIQIDEGISIGRLYRPGPSIVGEELEHYLSTQSIFVDGVEGRDWWRKYRRQPYNASNLEAVTVRIHPGRFGIPPYGKGEKKEPIKLSDFHGIRNYREPIDKILVSLGESSGSILWIGETGVKISMQEGVDAIIKKEVYSTVASRSAEDVSAEHIPALLLDGGKKPWPIRVENWGRVLRGLVDNFIDIYFFNGPQSKVEV